MAAEAVDSSCASVASWNGSRSEEFSGQSTRSGAGTLPALTCAASRSGLVDVITRDGALLAQRVEPGARHVALDGGDDGACRRCGGGRARDQQRAEVIATQTGERGAAR